MPDLLDDILAERAAAPAPTRDLLDDIMDERNASPPAASTSVSPANAPEVAATAPPPRRPGRVGGASPSAIAGRAEGAQPVSRAAVRQGFLNTLEQEGWLGSFTTAASGAVDKGLYRNEQGQWNPPIMAQVSPEPTLTDRAGQIAAALAQKTGGRLDQAGSGINAEGLRGTLDRFQQQTGMSDEGVKEVWQDAVALYRPWGADEHVRTLSDGALVPNPQDSTWLDPQKAGEMIGNLDATPEAKAQLMAKLPQLAEALSNAKLEGYEAAASAVNQASAAGSLGSLGLTRLAAGRVESPSEWAERTGRTGAGFGGPEFIRDYEREVIDPVSGPRKFIRGLTGKGLTGWNKLATTVLGVVGGVSDASAQLAAAGAEAGGVINQGLPDTGLAGSAMEEAPSLLAQYFSGQALGAVAGAVMGAGRAAQATTAAGIYLTAGAQSYGMQIADDLAEGKPIEKARENARRAGISATITSAALGAGALGGVEAAAAGNIGSATIRDLLNAAKAQGVRNIYKQPELRKFVQETVLAGVGERLQEQTDQFLQEFLTADPDTSLADAWDNSVKAGNVATILGAGAHVMGGAMVDTAADLALDAQVDAPDVAKVAADEVAAARRVAAAATTETLTDTDTPEGDVQGDFGITRQTDDRDTEMGTEGGPSLPQSQPVAVQSQVGGTETGASAGDVGADDRATQRGTAGLASEPLESSGEPLIFGRTWEQIQRTQQGDRPPALGPVDALRHAQKIVEDVRRFQIPVDASVVSRYELTLPNGYVREGDLYVYRPEQSPQPAPAPAPGGTEAAAGVTAESPVTLEGGQQPGAPSPEETVKVFHGGATTDLVPGRTAWFTSSEAAGKVYADNSSAAHIGTREGRPPARLNRATIRGVFYDNTNPANRAAVENEIIKSTEEPRWDKRGFYFIKRVNGNGDIAIRAAEDTPAEKTRAVQEAASIQLAQNIGVSEGGEVISMGPIRKQLEAAGFTGIKTPEVEAGGDGGFNYAVWNPEQVTFSEQSPTPAPPDVAPPSQQGQGQVPAEAGGGATGLAPVQPHETGVGAGVETRDDFIQRKLDEFRNTPRWEMMPPEYRRRAEEDARRKAENEWLDLQEQRYIAGQPVEEPPAWAETAQQRAERSGDTLDSYIEESHARIVGDALAAGKPVPDNVRREHEVYTLEQEEEWARLTLDSSEKYYVESAVGDVRRAYERKKDATAALPSDETHEVVKRSTNPNRWVVIEKFDAAQARARDILARLKQLRETSPAQQLAIFQSPTTPQTNEDEGQRQGQGQGLQVAPATEPAAAAAPDEGAAAGPVFTRDEIVVGQVRSGTKRREAGTDGDRWAEVRAPGKVLEPENWSRVDDSKLSAFVQAYYDFASRKAPKKTERSWIVRAGTRAVPKDVLARGLTFAEAVERAKDHVESANPPTNEATTQDQVAEAGSPAALEGQPTQPAPAGEAEAGAAQRGGEGAQGAEVVGREVPHAGTIAESLPAIREALPGYTPVFRIGDFHEFFGDDADLTGTAVTKRGGLRMSGVPPHQLSALQDIANRTGRPLAVITGNSVSEVVQPEPPVSPAGETAAVGEQQVAESATSLAGSTISEQGAPVRAAGEQMVTAASELQPGEVIQVGKTKHRVKSVTPLGDGRVEVDATGLFGADRVMRGDARVALVPQEPSPLQSAADQLAENAAEGRAEERRKLHLTPQNPFEPAALRNDIRAADLRSEDPAVEARWKGARLAKSKLITRLRNAITSVRQAFTRHFSKLDSVTDAVQIDILRQQEAVPQAARAEAVAILHGITSKLGPNKYDLFSRVVILPDIVRSIDQGLYDGKELPFGYADRAAVERDLVKFRDIASRYPDVMEALDARKRFMNALRDELVSRDLLPESVKDFDEYFHRQVIEMMNAREAFGTGTSSQDVRLHTKGFQKRRKGSSKDFNTNYIESEFEVISQAFAQIMTQDTLKRIKQTSDIRPALEQTAKQENLYALYGGEETYREALSIRAQIKELQSSPDSKESYVREQLAGLHERLNEIDPLVPHRLAKAIAKSRMSKTAAKDGYAGAPERFSDVVDRLADEHNNRGRSGEEAEFFGEDPPDTDFWGFVAWAADQGDFGALGLFKAIADERAFIKETLGDRFLTWRKLMSADYTTWQPKPGTQMYWANTVTERALEAYLQGSRELTESDFKKVLASAGPRQQWVIPKRLADTLDDFRPVRENFIEKFAGAGVSAWKVWTLLNPFRVVKYNVNNTSGDVDIVMAYDPAILKRVPKAARDAFQFQVRKTPASAEIKSLIDKGVMNSSFSVAEVPDIGGLEIFDALLGRKPNLIKRYWRTTKDYTTWREDILRLASSRHFLDKIRSGERPLGASKKVEMDQLYAARDAGTVTNEDIAAKLARELVGDYGNISVAGQWLRQHMIPFYSWMEINAPRYVRLMKNAKHEGTSGSPAAVATWAAAKKTSAFALKASIIYGLVSLWNRLFFPDEEKELGDQRGQLHLIIGRMPDGSVLSLRFQGALSDALSWFGAENLPADAAAMADGDKSLKDQAVEMLMATPNKIVNAASPIYKTTIEAMAGFSLYPDPTNPRPIRDRVRRMADLMSMGRIYDYLSDKPTRGVGHDILSTVFYTSDVGEASYFRIKSLVYDYNTKQGKDRPAALSTDKGDALFYYKQSLKFGDAQKAERWKQRYFEMGGTDAGIGQSIRASAPLAGVAMKDRKDFMETLSDEDRAMLLRAEQWYQKTYRSDNQ